MKSLARIGQRAAISAAADAQNRTWITGLMGRPLREVCNWGGKYVNAFFPSTAEATRSFGFAFHGPRDFPTGVTARGDAGGVRAISRG
jgi:hypothetical protein